MARTTRTSGKKHLRTVVAAFVATTALLGGAALASPAAAAPTPSSGDTRAVQPLSGELETIRAREASKLYGDSAIRPMAERQTSLVSLGDSEISGEGVGTYEPGTNGPDNWCHRSPDAAIHRTGIPADVTYNVACSGASTVNIRIGGSKQYDDELVQSDNLAIKARNTRVKMVLLVAGANDDLQFAPVISDCVARWVIDFGACKPEYDPGWKARIDGLVPKVEQAVRDLRTVMSDAGYADGDYKLVVMGYPSPAGPDIKDNPDFDDKLWDGCPLYDEDMAWGRNRAVPMFAEGIAEVARRTGASFLDNSRLFHGHEACMEKPWANGMKIDIVNPWPPDENSVRQSYHPNKRGHDAFASCLTQLYTSGWQTGGCADPKGNGTPVLYEGAWKFDALKNAGTGQCVEAKSGSTRVGTALQGAACTNGRIQRFRHDATYKSLAVEATQDRCLAVSGGSYQPGTPLVLGNCDGGTAQQFTRDSGTIKPQAATGLCASLSGAGQPLKLATCDGSANQRFGA